MSVLSLDSQSGATWTVRATAGPVPDELTALTTDAVAAVVPGEVQTDLMAAGVIPDPFVDDNEALLAWIGYCDWQYVTRFEWTSNGEERHDLVATGLDTAATITLNGREVARTANQHRSYRFDVAALLVEGENELVVDFRSPIEFAREQEKVLGALPTVMHHPFNAIRKTASNFGWDWGIDVSSSGIWKSIGIESWSGVRIAGVRPLVEVTQGAGVLNAHVELEWAGDTAERELAVSVNGVTATAVVRPRQTSALVAVNAGRVDLWWPRGYGDQPLYDVVVAVADALWQCRVGFRTIELNTVPDEHGTPFDLRVNGVLVNVHGANWIPDDAFLTRVTRERYRAAVRDAVEANMNLLRVWGGGIYESDHFYDACDESGVLVWQDFLFACAAYAEEDPLRSEVEAEARENIARLSSHPSLALWNGCNENIWGYVEWDWRRRMIGRTWGRGYYLDLLPSLVAELDPTRPYSPGSPFSFAEFAHPNDPRNGTTHIWDVWNEKDYSVYAEYRPRFVSEFGFQGPPAWSTLAAVVHDEPMHPYGHDMLVHQKAHEGNAKLERGLGEHLPEPADIDSWHWATQLNQARAVEFGIAHFRSLYPLTTGTIVWQLNDDWPVVSWAAVDANGVRKPLWYALRRVYAERLLTIQPTASGGLALIAHNDSDQPWSATVTVERRRVRAGAPLATRTMEIDLEPRAIVTLELETALLSPGDEREEFLRAHAEDSTEAAWRYFVEDTQLNVAPSADAYSATVSATHAGYDLSVTARSLAKDVTVQADRLAADARVDSALVSLAPGESHTFHITTTAKIEAERFLSFPVLCSANDLVGR